MVLTRRMVEWEKLQPVFLFESGKILETTDGVADRTVNIQESNVLFSAILEETRACDDCQIDCMLATSIFGHM